MTPHYLFNSSRCLAGLLLCLWVAPLIAQPGVTLSLKEADIRTLIETVSEATGLNFVVDPRVKAKVTVVSSQPMDEAELYQVFLSILQVHGYAAVPVGEIVKIVPDVTAKQGPVSVTESDHPGVGDELVTRVLTVEHVPAAQMVPILRPLVPQQGHLAAYASSNVLVISDRAANIERIEKIIRRIDRPDTQEIEVIPLEHASASEIVRIINALGQQDVKGARAPGKPILAADERTNSVLLGGDKSARLRIRGLIVHLDTPMAEGGNTQVVFLKYAQAEDLVPILQGVTQQQQKQKKGTQATTTPAARARTTSSAKREDVDIQADERNNAVVLTGPPAQINALKSIIRQLDIRRAQVLVESIIADVSTDLSRALGVEFGTLPKDEGSGPVVISNGASTGSSSLLDIIIGASKNELTSPGAGLFLGAASLAGDLRFAFLLRALDSDTATNILSTPTLVTMDNEEAQIKVGQQVPFQTGSFTTTADTSTNPFTTIERKDVGLTLTITPQINEGDTIKLEIEQDASQLASSTTQKSSGAVDLITQERTIKTVVMVENDQILVLGGLIQDEYRDTASKVPLLGDIPILGRLFRFDDTSNIKKNLMVFIHPVILRDEATATAYTGEKYSYLRARQLEAELDNRGLIQHPAAKLPDLDDLIVKVPEHKRAPSSNTDLDAFIDIE
jgi:general secretion pathway protein D